MLCKTIMTKSVKMCDANCTAKEAAQIMKKVNTGAVPIVDAHDKVLGIITDRDITIHVIAEGKDPSKVKIMDFMSKHIVTMHQDDHIDDAIRKMKENKVRRLPIVDDEDKLVGIISLGDLAVLSNAEHETFKALEEISEPVVFTK